MSKSIKDMPNFHVVLFYEKSENGQWTMDNGKQLSKLAILASFALRVFQISLFPDVHPSDSDGFYGFPWFSRNIEI